MDDIPALIRKAKNGDSYAFSLIYKAYYSPIYRYFYFRTKNKEQTEDLTQDVFLKAYSSLNSFKIGNSSPLAYFYTIARNLLIDSRRKKQLQIVKDEDLIDSVPDTTTAIEASAIAQEQSVLLHQCLDELTDDQQEVLTLRFLQELTYAEIAEITGRREDAIRQLQVRALKSLNEIFNRKYR